MLYLISYVDYRGELASVRIEAGSKEEACWLSRIPNYRIESISEDYIGRIKSLFESPPPNLKKQAIFLQTLGSVIASGKTAKRGIVQLIEHSAFLKRKKFNFDHCHTVSDFLKEMKFDLTTVMLMDAAEKTGKHVETLKKASYFLIEKEKVSAETASQMRAGIFYLIFGLLFLILAPTFFGSSLMDLVASLGGKFKPNMVTSALILWGDFVRDYYWIPIILFPLFFKFKKELWSILKKIPLFSLIERKILLSRGITFVMTYEMLHEAGFVDSDAISLLMKTSRGECAKIYRSIYSHLATSRDLATGFHADEWPSSIVDALGGFLDMDKKHAAFLMDTLRESLSLENVQVAKEIARYFSTLGFLMMIISVLCAAIGFYLPLTGAVNGML